MSYTIALPFNPANPRDALDKALYSIQRYKGRSLEAREKLNELGFSDDQINVFRQYAGSFERKKPVRIKNTVHYVPDVKIEDGVLTPAVQTQADILETVYGVAASLGKDLNIEEFISTFEEQYSNLIHFAKNDEVDGRYKNMFTMKDVMGGGSSNKGGGFGKTALVVSALFSYLFINAGCSPDQNNGDNGIDVNFYFNNLNKAGKGGTFDLSGVTKTVPSNGVYTEHFESAGNFTIDNVNMNDTKQDWLIVRYEESGENIGQQDVRTKNPISVYLNNGRNVHMIKIPVDFDMDTYKTYLEEPIRNTGTAMLTKENATGTDETKIEYIGSSSTESIVDKLFENTNAVDPWQRFLFGKDYSGNSRFDNTLDGDRFGNWQDYGTIPEIEKIYNIFIRNSSSTLEFLQEHVEGLLDREIDLMINNTLVNIVSPDDFTYKPKLNRILKLAFNFDPGTRFYATGSEKVQAFDMQGNPISGEDKRLYTPDEIRSIVRNSPLLQKVYASMIDPKTLEFKEEYKKKMLSNKRAIELWGQDNIENLVWDIRDIVLSNPNIKIR